MTRAGGTFDELEVTAHHTSIYLPTTSVHLPLSRRQLSRSSSALRAGHPGLEARRLQGCQDRRLIPQVLANRSSNGILLREMYADFRLRSTNPSHRRSLVVSTIHTLLLWDSSYFPMAPNPGHSRLDSNSQELGGSMAEVLGRIRRETHKAGSPPSLREMRDLFEYH